jgi:cobaltochelatase CobN
MHVRKLASLLALALLPCAASAATLFGVVSDRTAPAAAEAARIALEQHPQDRIVLRTQAQLLAANPRTVDRWLQDADAVFAIAAFSESAKLLQSRLDRLGVHAPKNFIALNGDSALSLRSRIAGGAVSEFPDAAKLTLTQDTVPEPVAIAAANHPVAAKWLALHDLWQAGGSDNQAAFMRHLLAPGTALPVVKPEKPVRLRVNGREVEGEQAGLPAGPALAVLDLSTSDPQPADTICAASRQRGMPCAVVLARWGEASKDAVERLPALLAPAKPAALVVLQDFVVGAAEGREPVAQLLQKLDVPVLKAIRLTDRGAAAWQLSEEGLPINSIQYRVAMPEVQGMSQPLVVAAAGKPSIDDLTGVELRHPEILPAEIQSLVTRAKNWQTLRSKPNRDKRIAIVYYNHPPGRQNIGADNLDVPQSLFDMLHALKAAGYTVGDLPASPEALLDEMQERGVNLPEDYGALARMAGKVTRMDAPAYARWFAMLPAAVRGELTEGPLGRLHAELVAAQQAGEVDIAKNRLGKSMRELRHLVEGADHPKRTEALALLDQLHAGYETCLDKHSDCRQLVVLKTRLAALGIEGLRGWGPPPGKVMVHDGQMLFPGLVFGNVFIGPQPSRGWEVDEELLHANTTIPPPHQYLGFYHWLKDEFHADALVHVGRHSTYEFLPGKAVGLSAQDYSRLVAGDLPGIYPYIVDGVGEGTAAKRRALTVMVDHLTPPLTSTPLYDRLLELRQVVESYESSSSDTLRSEAAKEMRHLVEALQLRAELEASMADVLQVRGIGFEQADDDLLAHEVGHYLTKLQEKFMPHGLHIFGRPWSQESLQLMLDSMAHGKPESVSQQTRDNLARSPQLEMQALLHGLDGGFIAPGKGNDPLRSPEALPTGRNFHALDGDVLPTRIGYQLGAAMATKARERDDPQHSEGVILWASDAVRDEGVMVSFILSLMGIEPEWNARGIVQKMKLTPPGKEARFDVVVTTSGLFRDLYPNLMQWIDTGGRMALAASADTILQAQPQLAPALEAALAPLGPGVERGSEPLARNGVALHWMQRTQALLGKGMAAPEAGRSAAWRIFGDAPGNYGAGVNILTERSGAWNDRSEVGQAYLNRMGHAYAIDALGEPAHAVFNTALADIATTYHGRASNLYGLMDNNDAFDYLGGLSLAVESITGHRPQARILNHADPQRPSDEPLDTALLMELRGRFLNPAWIRPLMDHGYAGARTMGQEFMENLWGWQVTRPDLIKDWAWDEVKRVYVDDGLKLGLDKFLQKGHNAQVRAHMLGLMLVAAHKGFWHADDATIRQLGHELATLVGKNGLPGSGHTAPTHPMWRWLTPYLDSTDQAALQRTLREARGENATAHALPPPQPGKHPTALASQATVTAPVAQKHAPANATPQRAYEVNLVPPPVTSPLRALWFVLLLPLFLAGLARGMRNPQTSA